MKTYYEKYIVKSVDVAKIVDRLPEDNSCMVSVFDGDEQLDGVDYDNGVLVTEAIGKSGYSSVTWSVDVSDYETESELEFSPLCLYLDEDQNQYADTFDEAGKNLKGESCDWGTHEAVTE